MPGGYDITALPLHVPPVPGEQQSSWLARWAHRYGLPVSQLLTELGIQVSSAPGPRLERQLQRHAATLTQAADLVSLPPGPGPLGPGGHLGAEVSRYLTSYHRHKNLPPGRSRYCPHCLAASGGVWLEAWSRPLHLACVTHQVLLARSCPDCRQARFTSTAWMTHETPVWICSEPARHPAQPREARTRYPLCGRDLRTVPAEPVNPADVAMLVRLRQAADDASAHPDGPARTYAGFQVGHRDAFDAVLELVVEQLGDIKPLVSNTGRPGPLLDAVRVAFRVLDQPDPGAALAVATQHRLLHSGGTVTPIGPDWVLGQRRRNPLLASIRLATLHERLSPSTELVFRSGSSHPRYPTPPGSADPSDQAQLAWIPQLIWPGQLTDWIDDRDYRDRACTAMLLAKVGSTRPWRFIAIDLGLPANFAVYPANLVRYLKQDGLWPDVLRRLDDLATRLEQNPPPINYQARRWAAARYDDVIAAVNHTMAYLGPPYPWCHTHMLAELFWQVYTGGDLRLAAPSSGTLLDPDRYHQDEISSQPITDPPLLAFLTATAATFNRAHDMADEPLTWQPPWNERHGQPPTAATNFANPGAGRWADAADLAWAPTLKLPHGRGRQAVVQDIVLRLADTSAAGHDDTQELTARVQADLEALHGIAHPDALAEIVPAISATCQALTGASHDPDLVDPTFRHQLRHSLNLVGRTPVGRADVSWDIGQKWRPAPPPKKTTRTPTKATRATKSAANQSLSSRSTVRGKSTRLDELEAIVKAARAAQLRNAAAQAHAGNPGN